MTPDDATPKDLPTWFEMVRRLNVRVKTLEQQAIIDTVNEHEVRLDQHAERLDDHEERHAEHAANNASIKSMGESSSLYLQGIDRKLDRLLVLYGITETKP